ncbi:MAG TPA: hypothetical protein VHX88_06680 [Solirubrobacteraceae bacterium]|nr:hypothetical protein [Solirubrobacteraceae bacterium]
MSVAVLATGLSAVALAQTSSTPTSTNPALAADPGANEQSGTADLPIDPQWLAQTVQSAANLGQWTNHTVPASITARDQNNQLCPRTMPNHSQADYCRQEYIVVWAGKENAADLDATDISDFISNLEINPEGLTELAIPQFAPGLDALAVIDARKYNYNHTLNPLYGHVVNLATLNIDGGIECEPHHMQYSWINGENLILGCLFSSWSFGVSVTDIPNVSALVTNTPLSVIQGSIPDAFDAVKYDNANHADDEYIGTWMGGPLYNYGGSPGALVTVDGSGHVLSVTPAGSVGQILTDPREAAACSPLEAEPVGTCANPHGVQARPDLNIMVTDDYAEPREIILDPVKPVNIYAFRPTVRIWNIANPLHPVEVSIAHMPITWRDPANPAHTNIGIMEGAKTHAAPDGTYGTTSAYNGYFLPSKGFFSESMCGGGVFWTPNATDLPPVSTADWHQVWDDGFSQLATNSTGENGGANSVNGGFEDEPGGCSGGAWVQTSPNNRWLFHSVQGRVPLADNYFDQGELKMVYVLDISHLVEDGEKGIEDCNMSQIDPKTGIEEGLEMAQIANSIVPTGNPNNDTAQYAQNPSTEVGDCPVLLDVLIVHDPTTGGPHWGALDDHTINADGFPTRLTFDDYFVARTGVDGDHRLYVVDISPTGNLTYDKQFVDEQDGSLGVDFNRRDWYDYPEGGFYKPHGMTWVCPPGDCTDDNPYAAG